jgi:AcrR family transcriptional regulator
MTAETKRTVKATRSDGERSRQTILEAAARLATVDGLNGLSIGSLADHIGMSKSGLYAHFGSKEELQLATIDTALAIFGAEVVEPTESISDPIARLEALCDRFLDHLARKVFPGGCFFAAAAAEFDTQPGTVKERIIEVNGVWFERLEQLVAEGQEAGMLSREEDPTQLAFELDSFLLMANTFFVLTDAPKALDRGRHAFQRRLNQARSR